MSPPAEQELTADRHHIEQHAHTVRVRLDGAPPVLADVTPATVAELHLGPGTRLWATVKATEAVTYPRAG